MLKIRALVISVQTSTISLIGATKVGSISQVMLATNVILIHVNNKETVPIWH